MNGPRVDSQRLVCEYLQTLDCPRSLSCWLLYRAGGNSELVQLVNLRCNPTDYPSLDEFRKAHAATKFLSKTSGLKTGIDTASVAIEAAIQAESLCEQTNRSWALLLTSDLRPERSPLIKAVIDKIATILGPVPDVFPDIGWSRGRTTSVSGPTLSPYQKYGARLDATASALRFARRDLRDSPLWGQAALEADGPVSVLNGAFHITKGNVMLTVPKNAKTDRVICYEPHMNIWLQLRVGDHIRTRLRSHGVNLDDQSINQRRAALGSKTGHLSTLDLRAASDTLASEVVRQVLPVDWHSLLDDLRSRYTLWPDGTWKRNQKFSSMGNGFTFELESLLFFAICKAVASNVSVYGDDIIVESSSYDACVDALNFFGFEINHLKSYSTGPFRESCGYDAYLGASCTPVYLRCVPKTLEDVVKLHNQVLEFASASRLTTWSGFGELLWKWRKRFPHLAGPKGFGDGHYHTNLDEACPIRARFDIEGWWFLSRSRVLKKGIDSLDGTTIPGFAAGMCAATGPRRPRSLWDSMVDRRNYRYKTIRVLVSFWPEVLWT